MAIYSFAVIFHGMTLIMLLIPSADGDQKQRLLCRTPSTEPRGPAGLGLSPQGGCLPGTQHYAPLCTSPHHSFQPAVQYLKNPQSPAHRPAFGRLEGNLLTKLQASRERGGAASGVAALSHRETVFFGYILLFFQILFQIFIIYIYIYIYIRQKALSSKPLQDSWPQTPAHAQVQRKEAGMELALGEECREELGMWKLL